MSTGSETTAEEFLTVAEQAEVSFALLPLTARVGPEALPGRLVDAMIDLHDALADYRRRTGRPEPKRPESQS